MLIINSSLSVPERELNFTQIRAQGPGGQNVNKVSSAVQLRFDIAASTLPERLKKRLLIKRDSRISKDGVIVITAQNHRSFKNNKEEALTRLATLIRGVAKVRKKRKPTRPSRNSQVKRVDKKTGRGKLKKMRKKIL